MADDELYNKVVEDYRKTGSVKQTAVNVGTTLVRAQRILITEGLWSSETSVEIGKLHEQGLSVKGIAEKLVISEKTVQAYLPYSRGTYGGGNRSNDSKKSEDYRNRMAQAEKSQINAFPYEEFDVVSYEELDEMRDKLDKEIREIMKNGTAADYSKSVYSIKEPEVRAYKLHLKLEYDWFDDHDMAVLQKYGRMKKSISRDIVVPASMTLHALHYAIQRAFGWENSHLHHFELPINVFQRLTGGTIYDDDADTKCPNGLYTKWADLCGIYFRFPTDDFDDIYWDDDYAEGLSFKSWLRRKYKGPYIYGGSWEHYHIANKVARKFEKDNPVIRLGLPFREWCTLKEQGELTEENSFRDIKMQDLTLYDLEGYFEGTMDELLERLPLKQLIMLDPVSDWKKVLEEVLTLSEKQKSSIPELPTIPLTNELLYKYDYGDGWKVRIKCEDVYYLKNRWDTAREGHLNNRYVRAAVLDNDYYADCKIYNKQFDRLDDETSFRYAKTILREIPICIAADGLPVMDDVGGLGGYVNFLEEIHGEDKDEADSSKAWANGMGWNGRMNKPENIL